MRILFISRYYPPHVSGGSRRAYELVKALRDSGEQVTIAAPYSGDDPHAMNVAHPQPEASTKPAEKSSWKDKLRTHLLYPDPDILWSLRVVKTAKRLYPEGFDYIITSSPPESIHVAGFLLKRAWGCHWLADFRDSWLEVPLYPIRQKWLRKWIEKRIARLILSKTDVRVTTLQAYSDEVKRLSGLNAHTLANFADPPKPIELDYVLTPNQIHVMHTGSFSLSDLGRSITPLLDIFVTAKAANDDLRLHLVGRLTDVELALIEACPMRDYITVAGTLSYTETRFIQSQAHALIVTAAPGAIAVPGKIEEYKAAHRPIIAIGHGAWTKGLNTTDPAEQLASLTREKQSIAYDLIKSDETVAQLKALMTNI